MKNKNTTDRSDAYRNLSFNKIDAPSAKSCGIKASVIKGKGDLRCKGGRSK